MRKLFVLFALFALCGSRAAAQTTNVIATFSPTNQIASRGASTNGDTLTINGDVRRYTNGVKVSATSWIQSTNSIGFTVTNTWLHLGTYRPAGVANIYPTNGTSVVVVGSINTALTVALSSGLGVVTYTTNTLTTVSPIVGPQEGVPTEAGRTNNISRLFALMNDTGSRATNAVANGIRGLSNLLDRITQQTASNKVFYTTTNRGGLSDGTMFTNVIGIWGSNGALHGILITGTTNLSGFVGSLTNGTLYSNVIHWSRFTNGNYHGTIHLLKDGILTNTIIDRGFATNLILYGDTLNYGDFTSSGSISADVAYQINGVSAIENDTGIMEFGNNAYWQGFRFYYPGSASANDTVQINAEEKIITARGFGFEVTLAGNEAHAIGSGGNSSYSNSMTVGPPDHLGNVVTTTRTNQIMVGTAYQTLAAAGFIQGTLSNLTTAAGQTNVLSGDLSFPTATITTIANGANRLNMGTNVFLDLTGSPSAAWTVDGIIFGAVVPRDGQVIELYNGTGYDATFAHNSGLEAVAGYRLSTTTSTNVIFTNAASARLRYSGSAARWRLINVWDAHEPSLTATATNAVGWLDGSATNLQVFGSGNIPLRVNAQTGSASNIFSLRTTNGAETVFVRSNHTLVASNFATKFLGGGQPGLQEIGLPVRIFSLTNAVTITNTTAATSWITNALWGTNWIADNVLTPGSTVRLRGYGFFSSVSATPCTFGLRSGNGLQLCTNTLALATSVVNDFITFEASFTVRASGASGSCYPAGTIAFPSNNGGANALAVRRLQNSAGAAAPNTVTIDTTAPFLLDFFITPGATTHGLTLMQCVAELIP